MKHKIDLAWTTKQLDIFLKENYGYGILNFRNCLLYIYRLFEEIYGTKTKSLYKKRIVEINVLKRRLFSLILNHLENIKFFDNPHARQIYKKILNISNWTEKNKELFIMKYYKFDALFEILENQKIMYKLLIHRKTIPQSEWNVTGNYRILPTSFLIIVLSFVMKRKRTVSWTNMSQFLLWNSYHIKNKKIKDMFYFHNREASLENVLRSTQNRYKDGPYYAIAKKVYLRAFNKHSNLTSLFKTDTTIKALLDGYKTWEESEMINNNDIFSILISVMPEVPEFKDALESAQQEIARKGRGRQR